MFSIREWLRGDSIIKCLEKDLLNAKKYNADMELRLRAQDAKLYAQSTAIRNLIHAVQDIQYGDAAVVLLENKKFMTAYEVVRRLAGDKRV